MFGFVLAYIGFVSFTGLAKTRTQRKQLYLLRKEWKLNEIRVLIFLNKFKTIVKYAEIGALSLSSDGITKELDRNDNEYRELIKCFDDLIMKTRDFANEISLNSWILLYKKSVQRHNDLVDYEDYFKLSFINNYARYRKRLLKVLNDIRSREGLPVFIDMRFII